ncbi:MAG: hypothetical protein STHCBS139747_001891 [Sporothrix thermara]
MPYYQRAFFNPAPVDQFNIFQLFNDIDGYQQQVAKQQEAQQKAQQLAQQKAREQQLAREKQAREEQLAREQKAREEQARRQAANAARKAAAAQRQRQQLQQLQQRRVANPVSALESLFGLDFGLDELITPAPRAFSPRFDVRETESTYELHGELAGVERKNVSLEFTEPQTLVISGKIERNYTSGSPLPVSSSTTTPTPAAVEAAPKAATEATTTASAPETTAATTTTTTTTKAAPEAISESPSESTPETPADAIADTHSEASSSDDEDEPILREGARTPADDDEPFTEIVAPRTPSPARSHRATVTDEATEEALERGEEIIEEKAENNNTSSTATSAEAEVADPDVVTPDEIEESQQQLQKQPQQQEVQQVQAAATATATATPSERYWVQERAIGQFKRVFNFPVPVDEANVRANLENGILSVSIPKAKREVRRIVIF